MKSVQFSNTRKQLAVVIDPDKTIDSLHELIDLSLTTHIDYFLVGGSLLIQNNFERTIELLKKNTEIPVIIFPGSNYQISPNADAILLLSLVSGRNPEYLIHQHVQAAFPLHQSGLQIIPTGYVLIEGGVYSSTQYISNTMPIPKDKPEIAIATSLAAEQLGMKCIYLEAGSGANFPASKEIIQGIKKYTSIPLIVGGGIRDAETALRQWEAGADIVVIGNALEKNPSLIKEISAIKP